MPMQNRNQQWKLLQRLYSVQVFWFVLLRGVIPCTGSLNSPSPPAFQAETWYMGHNDMLFVGAKLVFVSFTRITSWYKHQKCTLCTVLCGGRREWQLIPGSMCSKGASTEVVLQRNSERWVLHSQDLVGDLQVSWQWTITEIRSSPRTMPFGWLQTFNAESSVNSLALHCAS